MITITDVDGVYYYSKDIEGGYECGICFQLYIHMYTSPKVYKLAWFTGNMKYLKEVDENEAIEKRVNTHKGI